MKSARRYYIPGMISLVGLPILLFFWGPQDHIYYTCIRHNLPSSNDTSSVGIMFSNKYVLKSLKNKKVITVVLDKSEWGVSDNYVQDRKYKFVTSEIERLQFTGDTMSVLKIHLGAFNTYGDFVWMINQAMIYDYKRYALVADDLYFFPSPQILRSYEGIPYYRSPLAEVPEYSQWDELKDQIKYSWRVMVYRFGYWFDGQQQNRQIAYGFLLLIFTPSLLTIIHSVRNRSQRINEHQPA